MKNQETLGNRRFSKKESHLPFLCRLRRRAKIFRNLGIFEKTPIDESLNPAGGTPPVKGSVGFLESCAAIADKTESISISNLADIH